MACCNVLVPFTFIPILVPIHSLYWFHTKVLDTLKNLTYSNTDIWSRLTNLIRSVPLKVRVRYSTLVMLKCMDTKLVTLVVCGVDRSSPCMYPQPLTALLLSINSQLCLRLVSVFETL